MTNEPTDVPGEFFSDLRSEVDLAAQRFAAIVAQRDTLQARIDAYEGDVERQERMTRLIENSSFSSPEAIAMREQTPPEVAWAIVKASEYRQRAEAAEAETASQADYIRELIAKRDRLQAVVDVVSAAMHELGDDDALTAAVSDALDQLDGSPDKGG